MIDHPLADDPLLSAVREARPSFPREAFVASAADAQVMLERVLAATERRPFGAGATKGPRRWWGRATSLALIAMTAAVAVVVAAVFLAGHHRAQPAIRTSDAVPSHPAAIAKLPVAMPAGPLTANPNSFQGAAIPHTVRLVAETADPHGGLPWGLRQFKTTRGQTCLQVGRVQDGTIGVIGQDGAWHNDHRFHPISPNAYTGDSCSQTDARGDAFNNVAVQGKAASADVPWGTGAQSGECRTDAQPKQFPVCPRADLRDLDYGLLGPDATRITYLGANRRLYTEATNPPDGAYLIVLPGSSRSCSHHSNGGTRCTSGGGETSGPALQARVITAVTYRDGHQCQLRAPTSLGVTQSSCPPVGYVPPRGARPPAARVASSVSIRTLPATSYCKRLAPDTWIPCDGRVPRGYRRESPTARGHQLLIEITFTARIAVPNSNSEYEFALSKPTSPTCPGGGAAGTTSNDVHAGQHVLIQVMANAECQGRFSAIVTYQPTSNAATNYLLSPRGPVRDGSITVGQATLQVR
jgi:hypothetical protein